jgi:nucleotide-binding universal stress UspA family protein
MTQEQNNGRQDQNRDITDPSLPVEQKLLTTPDSELHSDTILVPEYSKILIPHDNTAMSDKALGHAIYLANATGAEIVILFVMENIDDISKSSLIASINEDEKKNKVAQIDKGKEIMENTYSNNLTEGNNESDANLTITAHGEAKKMIVEKLNLCKASGAIGLVSYRLTTGRSVEDEIINLVNIGDADLIIMSSGTISSSIRSIGSTARKVIDNVDVPVLIIHR